MTDTEHPPQHVPCPDCGNPSPVLHWTPAGWKCRACRSAYRERALAENAAQERRATAERGGGRQPGLFG